jgi:hypothetical protein
MWEIILDAFGIIVKAKKPAYSVISGDNVESVQTEIMAGDK